MHLTSIKKEKTKYFTRWDTFRNRAKRWLGLQGENQKIAETYKHCLEVDNVPEDTGFHSTCYRRFIDIYGKGKRKAFSVACEKDEYLTAFTNLGSSFNLDQSNFVHVQVFYCQMHRTT